jgi:hypothetical protein
LRARVIALLGSDHDIAQTLPGFLCQGQADSAEFPVGLIFFRDEAEAVAGPQVIDQHGQPQVDFGGTYLSSLRDDLKPWQKVEV